MPSETRITIEELRTEIQRILGELKPPKGFTISEISEATGVGRTTSRSFWKKLAKAGWIEGKELRKNSAGHLHFQPVLFPPENVNNAKLTKDKADTAGQVCLGKTANPNSQRLMREVGRSRKTS